MIIYQLPFRFPRLRPFVAKLRGYYAFDILWLNGRDLRELSLLDRKKILRSVIPRKSVCVGYVSYVDRQAMKLFELIKKQDLEGLVVKRKDGKYAQQTLWYKILNPAYTRNETSPLIITLNTIQRISNTLLGLHDPEKLNAAVIDLQSAIVDSLRQAIAVQQSHVALEIKARDLEAENKQLRRARIIRFGK